MLKKSCPKSIPAVSNMLEITKKINLPVTYFCMGLVRHCLKY